jgi:tripartite ATP-independent transporter DctP family solute receptor
VAERFYLGQLALAVVLILSGCSSQDSADGVLNLRMAHVYEVNSPTHAYGTAFLSERIRGKSEDLDITVYPASQLGSESELLEQLVAGELDLVITGPSFLAMWHPPIGVLDAAYCSRDLDHMLEIANSEEMAPEWDELRKQYDVRVLDTWAYGSRHVTSNVPIRSPKDLEGFRLRAPGARIFQASAEALGASPMPIAFSEVYLALQQEIADGQENPVPVIKSMGFHEVQKCLNLTGHIQSSLQILVNERTWRRMTDEQQASLQAVIKGLGKDVYQGLVQDEKELIEQWQIDGTMEIIEDVDMEAFRSRCREYFSEGFEFSEVYNRITKQSQGDVRK